MDLDDIYRVHLNWMFDNQPSLVRELLRKGKLKEYLDRKDQAAMRLVSRLKQRGKSEDEAYEVAVALLLAPPDGPAMSEDPPKPLNYRERKAVLQQLERLGDLEEAEEAKQATKH